MTAYLALNFAGSSTYSSRAGVRREISTYIPLMAVTFGAGVIFHTIGRNAGIAFVLLEVALTVLDIAKPEPA